MLSAENLYEVQQSLFGRNRDKIVAGLDRIRDAARDCGNPQFACKVVHVAGTNGKGSTAAMIAEGLRVAGKKVGLFTSPHIFHFAERFRINGEIVPTQILLAIYDDLSEICEKYDLTFFEISTLIAFELFLRENCDWVVLETGMGGRLDATNICKPALCVITSVGIDHTAYLGNSVEEIAREKLGIVKRNSTLAISGANEEKVIKQAEEHCKNMDAAFVISDLSRVKEVRDMAMSGDFQKVNFVLALTAMEILGFGGDGKIAQAMAKTVVTARMQKIEIKGKTVIFDVAHNPQATRNLADSFVKENHKNPVSLIFAMMNDKDSKESISALIGAADKIFCFTPTTKRARPADYLAQDFRDLGAKDGLVFVCKSAEDALKNALNEGETVLVTGSFYAVSQVFAAADFYGFQ